MSMEVRRGLKNSILLQTLTCELEAWTWNRAQQSRVRAMKMTNLRGPCSNEAKHGSGGVGKENTLKWLGHDERMKSGEFCEGV